MFNGELVDFCVVCIHLWLKRAVKFTVSLDIKCRMKQNILHWLLGCLYIQDSVWSGDSICLLAWIKEYFKYSYLLESLINMVLCFSNSNIYLIIFKTYKVHELIFISLLCEIQYFEWIWYRNLSWILDFQRRQARGYHVGNVIKLRRKCENTTGKWNVKRGRIQEKVRLK